MTNAALIRRCTVGLACGLWASAAFAAPELPGEPGHCIAKHPAQARARNVPCAASRGESHLAALLAAHELTAIELGGAGLDPMRWGDRGAAGSGPEPIPQDANAVPISQSQKGCRS